jgi:hypothetical protein
VEKWQAVFGEETKAEVIDPDYSVDFLHDERKEAVQSHRRMD